MANPTYNTRQNCANRSLDFDKLITADLKVIVSLYLENSKPTSLS